LGIEAGKITEKSGFIGINTAVYTSILLKRTGAFIAGNVKRHAKFGRKELIALFAPSPLAPFYPDGCA
jgi:hypothetical protein